MGTGDDERFGDYELRQRVAVGGMAEIFLARRCRPAGFAKAVAVKRVLPELARQESFRRMFADEARICASLNHPGLVQVFDYGEVDGVPFLVMEWVDGCDLATLIHQGEPLPQDVAALVAAEICRALDYVHAARDDQGTPLNIVHRDLSPGNVLISRSGDVKLGDFGVAQARGRLAKTETGKLKGTLAYLAPEQVSGGTLDHRTDIYAVGLLLFELLTGERYVRGDSELELLKAAAAPPERTASSLRPELSRSFDPILARALSLDPEGRYPDAGALEAELRKLCPNPREARDRLAARLDQALGDGDGRRRTNLIDAGPPTWGERLRLLARRRGGRWVWISAAALGAAALAGLGIWLAGPDEPPTNGPATAAAPAATERSDLSDPTDIPDASAPSAPSDPSEEDEASDEQAAPDASPSARPRPTRPPVKVERPPPAETPPRAEPPPGSSPEPPPEPPPAEAAEDPPVSEEPGEVGPSPAELLRRADRLRGRRGIRPGDDPELDRLRSRAAALAAGGGAADEACQAVAAYRERIGEIVIDRAFVERKMRRATRAIEAAQPSGERAARLDVLSQQALRSALSRDFEGANRTLNQIFDLVR